MNIKANQSSFCYQEKIERVAEFIHHNLDQKFTLEQLSQIAGFSKFHFNRQFSLYTGVSTFKFIQLMRLKRASYQLAFNGEIKIIDIALDAQFENHESFSRAFKRIFSQSPTQFRLSPDWPSWREKVLFPIKIDKNQKVEKAKMKVELIDFEQRIVAMIQHRGAPEKVLESAGKFIQWRKQSKLSPIKSSETFGVAHDDPKNTAPENFRFDICGTVDAPVLNNPQGVVSGTIPGGRCAVVRHLGSHDKMNSKIYFLYCEWLPSSGEELRDFPCFFKYFNSVTDVPEHELVTDIYLPIK